MEEDIGSYCTISKMKFEDSQWLIDISQIDSFVRRMGGDDILPHKFANSGVTKLVPF